MRRHGTGNCLLKSGVSSQVGQFGSWVGLLRLLAVESICWMDPLNNPVLRHRCQSSRVWVGHGLEDAIRRERTKIGIVGAGAVGAACLMSVVLRGTARDVVLINRNRKRAQGVVTDVQYGGVLSSAIAVDDDNDPDLSPVPAAFVRVDISGEDG